MKSVIIIAIAVVFGISMMIFSNTVFAQDSLKCPKGAYYGLDNQGNEACRDIKTNQIIVTYTGIIGEPSRFAVGGIIALTLLPEIMQNVIPDWVKNVAAFWCDDKIDDAAFIEGIQYLIDNDIIIVQATSAGTGGSQEIPSWVKNNACWWSLGSMTDKDFASGLEYLIKEGIIKISNNFDYNLD